MVRAQLSGNTETAILAIKCSPQQNGSNLDLQNRRQLRVPDSDFTGIEVDVYTDQDAFQVYSCNGSERYILKSLQRNPSANK